MKFKSFFILSLFLAAVIIFLDYLAFRYAWYWRWRWFDEPMHFLGGLLVGLIFIQIYFYFFKNQPKSSLSFFELVVLGLAPVIFIGLIWEFLEFTADKVFVARVALKPLGIFYQGWRASAKDLTFGLIGSLTAIELLISRLLWQNKK